MSREYDYSRSVLLNHVVSRNCVRLYNLSVRKDRKMTRARVANILDKCNEIADRTNRKDLNEAVLLDGVLKESEYGFIPVWILVPLIKFVISVFLAWYFQGVEI